MIFRKITALVMAAVIALSALVLPVSATGTTEMPPGAVIPERYLEGNELELYRLLLECMIWVSDGRRDAQTFYLNTSRSFASKQAYEKAIDKVMYFIYSYAPECSYWTDSRGSIVYDTVKCGIIYGISPVYQELGNEYAISSTRLAQVRDALENAKLIADKYSGANDFKKVLGYAKEICAMTNYDYSAAADTSYMQENVDPWSIISVFDNDFSTDVVCAGYAKAFQYLCDLGGVECHYVTGDISAGLHAWNIVVIDGKNYLVDLTVCDQYSEEVVAKDHPFVLNSVVSSTAEGFTAFYSGSEGTHSVTYTYDKDVIEYLPEELRILSTKAYQGRSKVGAVIVVILAVGGIAFYLVKKKRNASFDY